MAINKFNFPTTDRYVSVSADSIQKPTDAIQQLKDLIQ